MDGGDTVKDFIDVVPSLRRDRVALVDLVAVPVERLWHCDGLKGWV